MRLAICDDEEEVRAYIKKLLQKTADTHEIAEFADGEGLLMADIAAYDAIFLDIGMRGMSGMEAAEKIRDMQAKESRDIWGGLPLLIFVTGYKEHMAKAFGVHAFSYLVKPFEEADFFRIYAQIADAVKKKEKKNGQHLLIKTGGEARRIPLGEILYIESEKRKNILHLAKESVTYYGSMEELEQDLPESFFRVHKGYIVNMDYVEKYDRSRIALRGGGTVWISKYRYAQFVEAYLKFIR